ncbi:MAG: hypothetical protein HY078_13980 [Elusimicrobia bacterium]|nr:hypothetical protein [Elusimicrobiota bacterium]
MTILPFLLLVACANAAPDPGVAAIERECSIERPQFAALPYGDIPSHRDFLAAAPKGRVDYSDRNRQQASNLETAETNMLLQERYLQALGACMERRREGWTPEERSAALQAHSEGWVELNRRRREASRLPLVTDDLHFRFRSSPIRNSWVDRLRGLTLPSGFDGRPQR